MGVQRIGRAGQPLEMEFQADRGGGLGDALVELARALGAAELGQAVLGAVDALARHVGIELEGVPGDGEAQVLLLQDVERALEVALADVAPGADRVGDDVDAANRLCLVHGGFLSLLQRSLYPRRIPGNEENPMEKPKYRSALIVGTGPGLSASLARLFARNGLAVSLAARQTDKLAALAKETGAAIHACNAADAEGRCRPVRGPRRRQADARRRGLQRQQPGARRAGRPAARRRQARHRDQRLRRLPGLPAGGAAHAAQVAWRHLPDRRDGRREGLRAVGHLRHGQVRAARPGAIDGARALAPRASMSRIS